MFVWVNIGYYSVSSQTPQSYWNLVHVCVFLSPLWTPVDNDTSHLMQILQHTLLKYFFFPFITMIHMLYKSQIPSLKCVIPFFNFDFLVIYFIFILDFSFYGLVNLVFDAYVALFCTFEPI